MSPKLQTLVEAVIAMCSHWEWYEWVAHVRHDEWQVVTVRACNHWELLMYLSDHPQLLLLLFGLDLLHEVMFALHFFSHFHYDIFEVSHFLLLFFTHLCIMLHFLFKFLMTLHDLMIQLLSPLMVLLHVYCHEETLSDVSIVIGLVIFTEQTLDHFEEKCSMEVLRNHLVESQTATVGHARASLKQETIELFGKASQEVVTLLSVVVFLKLWEDNLGLFEAFDFPTKFW